MIQLNAVYALIALTLFALAWTPLSAAEGSVVELVRDGERWQLLRNGEPYFIKGAGGHSQLELLAEIGGNSIRTWGIDEDTIVLLDEAHRLGITVTMGYWMGHKRHGFNYDDPAQVARQHEAVLAAVRMYKDHPAVLCWAVGNEMELEQWDNENMWRAVGDAAAAIKAIDPNHPVMTVIADLAGDKNITNIKRHCPAIDIVGINSYGGIYNLAERYLKQDPGRPYVVTEYAPVHELGNAPWDRVREMNTSQKAAQFITQYAAAITDHPDHCLGGYLFVWGRKSEITETMFGTFTKDGMRIETVETFRQLYGGQPATNVPPTVLATDVTEEVLAPGATTTASIQVEDPDGDPVTYHWELRHELGSTMGGDHIDESKVIPGAVVGEGAEVSVTAPERPGEYRLYVQVNDGQGCAAYANWPLLVKRGGPPVTAPKAPLPCYIYQDQYGAGFVPSGVMGDTGSVALEPECTEQPHNGAHCLRVTFSKADGWAGAVWQDPPNDWDGAQPGGKDFTGATRLSFWARGAMGGEQVAISFGLVGLDKPHFDTAKGKLDIVLTTEWQRFEIDVSDLDLRRIKTPFCWVVGGQGQPLVFYFDDVRWE